MSIFCGYYYFLQIGPNVVLVNVSRETSPSIRFVDLLPYPCTLVHAPQLTIINELPMGLLMISITVEMDFELQSTCTKAEKLQYTYMSTTHVPRALSPATDRHILTILRAAQLWCGPHGTHSKKTSLVPWGLKRGENTVLVLSVKLAGKKVNNRDSCTFINGGILTELSILPIVHCRSS